MLRRLGLDQTTEAVYRLMLRNPRLGVVDLAGELGVGEDVVRAGLDRLADLSLLRPTDAPAGVTPVSPHVGLETLIAGKQAELARMQQVVEESREAVTRFVAEFSSAMGTRELSTLERLIGVDSVRLCLEELSAEATSQTCSLAPGGPQTRSNRDASHPITSGLLARGVRVRTVYLDSVRNDQASLQHALWLHEMGGEVRTAPTLPLRLQIIDAKAALLPLDPLNTAAGAVLVREPGVVHMVAALFEQIWDLAKPTESPPESVPVLSAREQEVLKMLSRGMTDQAIARHLAVSLRTERRIISDLMERLDAQTRFQLGQQAVRHGHL